MVLNAPNVGSFIRADVRLFRRIGMKFHLLAPLIFLGSLASVIPAAADSVLFSTGNVDGLIAAASRPAPEAKAKLRRPTILHSPTALQSAALPLPAW
jgi:hypothetical protein